MRAIKFFAASLIGLACTTLSFAQTTTTETFKVNGNCGMCKSAIEKAAKSAGAQKAEWNKDTKELTVTYTTATTNTAKIQQKVAEVGYDNVGFTATTESYDKLHGCCKYDRTAMASMKDKKSCCGANCDMKDGKCDMSKCTDMAACKEMGDCAGKASKDMDCCKDGKCSKEGHKGGDCCEKK
jgi:hypothetical protein